jgi:saccharopine dehydrogenase (NAD+, L-lysine-forming)
MAKQITAAILGCGGVGTSVALDLANSKLVSKLVLADVNLKGPEYVKARTKSDKIEISKVDASKPKEVAKVAKKADIVLNGTAIEFNLTVMEGCLKGGANYIDMANGDVEFGGPMFEDQQKMDKQFRDAGIFAICALGIDPGASNIFAKRAADRMDSLDYVKVRDADTGQLEGYEFATYFAPLGMLEECIKDPLYYEGNGKDIPKKITDPGYKRSPALTVSEVYDFPKPIGPMKVFRTDHEEAELVPKFIGKPLKSCSFMISLDPTFVEYVKVLKKLGLTSHKPIRVKGMEMAPIDMLVAVMPRPDDLGGKIKGNAMVLTEVGGKMKGESTVIRTWTHISHEKAYEISGMQATVYQTAMPVAVAIEMFAREEIKLSGVNTPESVDPIKFCEYLPAKNTPVFEEIIRGGVTKPA